MQLHLNPAALLLALQAFVLLVLASPVVVLEGDVAQEVLAARPPLHEHGETPPKEDTVGWIDPRLNGGRFIDVSALSQDSGICAASGLFLTSARRLLAVHHEEVGRAVEHHHLLSLRSVRS